MVEEEEREDAMGLVSRKKCGPEGCTIGVRTNQMKHSK